MPSKVAVLVCFGIILQAARVHATLISSSRLLMCANRGDGGTSSSNSSSTDPLLASCQQKFVVAMAIDGGQNGTEQVAYWSSATDDSGRRFTLKSPVTIRVAKTNPMIRYPVYYRRNFNAKPSERTIYTSVIDSCFDAPADTHPTCGRAYDDNGRAIPSSEGFCCNCNVCELLGLCGNSDRGNTRCALFGSASAAACLVFGELWYSGFDIGPAETWYSIVVTISHENKSVELILGPDRLGAVSHTFGVSARLVGDFAAFREPLNLEHTMLFIPAAPLGHPRVSSRGVGEWLLVRSDRVTLDGRECDKVGVSYEAFNRQGSRCDVASGSCLANQLEDLRTEDKARIAQGNRGLYFVDQFGDFAAFLGERPVTQFTSRRQEEFDSFRRPLTNRSHFSSLDNSQPYIAYRASHVQASLLTLQFVADNMSFTINVADGKILSTNITEFAANSRNGVLAVSVMNTGALTADFHVAVGKCTEGTMPIAAQIVTLAPHEVRHLKFDVVSTITAGQQNNCNVTLQDALFNIVDSAVVTFRTTATNMTQGAQGGTGNGAAGVELGTGQPGQGSSASLFGGGQQGRSGTGAGGDTEGDGDCMSCPFYNPVCFVAKQCFWAVVIQVLVVLAILAAIFFIIKHRKFFCGCCYSKKEEEKEDMPKARGVSPQYCYYAPQQPTHPAIWQPSPPMSPFAFQPQPHIQPYGSFEMVRESPVTNNPQGHFNPQTYPAPCYVSPRHITERPSKTKWPQGIEERTPFSPRVTNKAQGASPCYYSPSRKINKGMFV